MSHSFQKKRTASPAGIITRLPKFLLAIVTSTLFAISNTQAAEEMSNLLLRIDGRTSIMSYELVFTNVEDESVIRISETAVRGRIADQGSEFILVEAPPGRYYLSRVNKTYDHDNLPLARLRQPEDLIELYAGAINYIGDVILVSDDIRDVWELSVQYEPNSSTLTAAAAAHTELFKSLPILVVVPGAEPVRIEPSLLGI